MHTEVKYTFRQRTRGAKELLHDLFIYNPFTKKQKKLLLMLTTFKPFSTFKLKEKIKSRNIKSLVRDTNGRLRKNYFGRQIKIVSCYKDLGLKETYRLILPPFSD